MHGQREFGGEILQISNGSQSYFTYTEPVMGDWNSVAWTIAPACNVKGKQDVVAGYHSHDLYGLPTFSSDDKNGVVKSGVPMYLINSAGVIGRLNLDFTTDWKKFLYDIPSAYR